MIIYNNLITVSSLHYAILKCSIILGHGHGSVGLGHTTSCTSTGQNSCTLSNKYHLLSKESPSGTITCGRSVGVEFHDYSFHKLMDCTLSDLQFLTNTLSGCAELKRK